MYLTADQIANRANRKALTGRSSIAFINRLFRQQDESHLWPINNRFDATERAIRKVRKQYAEYGMPNALEYALALDAELSRIVNAEV